MRSILLSTILFSVAANAATLAVKRAAACCETLQEQLPGKVFAPGSPEFGEEQSSYYSGVVSQQTPACRVSPSSAEDVSTALKTLKAGQCQFAVRSGGHMPWKGSNNIDAPGITIDMGNMNSITLTSDKKVVQLGPGNRWGPVYDALAPENLIIVGGRSNTVGVGGYLLGGGISHLNAQHGLAAQNIVNYEIVLADGTIANVNDTNPDLHTALQAGSTNFGIVTRYDLATYPRQGMWGGLRSYDISEARNFLEGTMSFMDAQVNDPLAGGMIISMTNETMSVTMAYWNGDGPQSNAFDEINAIPSTVDQVVPNTTQQELSDLVDGAFPGGRRSFSNVLTFKADVQFALDLNAKAHELFEPLKDNDVFWATTFQPFGKAVTSAIASKPSFQGLDTETGDHLLVFGIGAYWDDAALDEPLDQWSRDLLTWGAEESQRRGLGSSWLYLNYALPWQPVYESFGAANHQKLKDLKAQYDPENVFGQLWPGGYKL
ncbi:fad binding domain-containing protein [Moniliophthora roreri MCA 2997]|uniref:Fad binding domain-containing protein n=2 Tax=Moniliophthora roreri TaxID=221103 RepID=V2WZY7_MONRO|nr:fad binding domain-containing protein [Moniliophthora roreri MCA 2997]KAI3621695.1 fad binding domain-containing protein [Moniliophthora roreri]